MNGETEFWDEAEPETPCDELLSVAIEVYSAMKYEHEHPDCHSTLAEVAKVFRITPRRAARAIHYHPWMLIEKEPDGQWLDEAEIAAMPDADLDALFVGLDGE